MTSSRTSLEPLASSGSRRGMVVALPSLPMARTTVGSERSSPPLSRSSSVGSARGLPISASASTARSRTHQSLSRVASIR